MKGSSPKIAGIYEIVNDGTADHYIGSSVNLRKRLWDHKKQLTDGKHENPKLQAAWNKTGGAGFRIGIVLLCSPGRLLFYEQLLLSAYKPNLNIAERAGGYGKERRFTEEQVREIRRLRGEERWSMPRIGAQFGTTKQVVWHIVHRSYYDWID